MRNSDAANEDIALRSRFNDDILKASPPFQVDKSRSADADFSQTHLEETWRLTAGPAAGHSIKDAVTSDFGEYGRALLVAGRRRTLAAETSECGLP